MRGMPIENIMLLDPGFDLTLRPMKYPDFYEMYRNSIKNTWTVEEVDFSTDVMDLKNKMTASERHHLAVHRVRRQDVSAEPTMKAPNRP